MNKELIEKLEDIKAETNNKLIKDVIETLQDEEEIESYIEDLMQHGCQSGMVGSLIYYNDTLRFYQDFKKEINTLLKETLLETGLKSPSELFGDKWDDEDIFAEEENNQNLLSWFGFEETVRQIAYSLDMEV